MRSIIKFIKEKRTAIIGIFIGVLCGITCFAFFVNIKSRALVATNVDIPKIVKARTSAFGIDCVNVSCGQRGCGILCCAVGTTSQPGASCTYFNGRDFHNSSW